MRPTPQPCDPHCQPLTGRSGSGCFTSNSKLIHHKQRFLLLRSKLEPGSTSKVQLGLFSPQLPEHYARLDVTLARIRALVGDGNVGCPALKDTNQIDGFVVKPFCIPTTQAAEIIPNPLRPAMRMLRPAEATFVTLESRAPEALHLQGESLRGRECIWSVAHKWRMVVAKSLGMRTMGLDSTHAWWECSVLLSCA